MRIYRSHCEGIDSPTCRQYFPVDPGLPIMVKGADLYKREKLHCYTLSNFINCTFDELYSNALCAILWIRNNAKSGYVYLQTKSWIVI